MIYVRIELWPRGSRTRARCLQEGIIYNTGGDHSTGEYTYRLSKVGGFRCSEAQIATGQVKNVLRQGEIKGFPRLRLYAHDLLLRALTLAFGDRADWGEKQGPVRGMTGRFLERSGCGANVQSAETLERNHRALNPDNGHGAADGMGGHGEYCECSDCLADDRARHGG